MLGSMVGRWVPADVGAAVRSGADGAGEDMELTGAGVAEFCSSGAVNASWRGLGV
jgi:hypothetical protein